MSRNVVISVVVVLVLIVAGWLFTRPKSTMAPEVTQPTEIPTSTQSAAPSATSGAMMEGKTLVTISSSGFSPKTIKAKVGDTITWTNSDADNHTVNSDPHPTHTLYPFLNLGVIKPGEKQSVIVSKAGVFTYHDHLNPSNTGSITVE